MNVFFTADQHFGHANIIEYCNRPFFDLDGMTDAMVIRWNTAVGPDDLVFVLGDFTLGGYNQAAFYFSKLNGRIKVVPGGHDDGWLKKAKRSGIARVEILPPLVTIELDGMHVTLCHYPMLSWERSHYGQPHLHGHTHGTIRAFDLSSDVQLPPEGGKGRRIDVGVDVWNFTPVSWTRLKEFLCDQSTFSSERQTRQTESDASPAEPSLPARSISASWNRYGSVCAGSV